MNDTKSRILEAASRLFLRGGTSALSVRAIADCAGVSTIGIYSHFQGKQGILDALYIEGFQRVTQAMDVRRDGITSRAAVLDACTNYLEIAERYEAHYHLIFDERDGNYVPSQQARAVGAQAFERLTDLVSSLLPVTTTLAERQDAAIQVWSVIHGFVSLKNHAVAELADMSAWKSRALATVEVVIDALAARSAE